MYRGFMKFDYIMLAFLIIGCGLTNPKVVVYENGDPQSADVNGSGTTSGGGTGGDAVALKAFQDNVGKAASSTCAGCHAATKIKGKTLVASGDTKDATNRAVLLGYIGSDCDSFADFLATDHAGGDQSSTMPASKINAWLATEASCGQ
jgi:hypothetical protein